MHKPGTVSHHFALVIQGDIDVTPEQLIRLHASRPELERLVAEEAQRLVRRFMNGAGEEVEVKPKVEPGLPLRQFIRGFLRDHLGFSKIMAHHAADLFMKRWQERDEKRARRYAREDQHTTEATRDRKAAEWLDKNTERL